MDYFLVEPIALRFLVQKLSISLVFYTILFDIRLDFKYLVGDLNMDMEAVQTEAFIINQDSLEQQFKEHLADIDNHRVLFSGPFGQHFPKLKF